MVVPDWGVMPKWWSSSYWACVCWVSTSVMWPVVWRVLVMRPRRLELLCIQTVRGAVPIVGNYVCAEPRSTSSSAAVVWLPPTKVMAI